ncbi:MAG: Holliday junction resolvase Hjc [Candidatus Diapherotrites archaeon]
MAHYRKGADAERELIQMLFEKGFSVARVAGSGATSLPCPDCLALSERKKMAFECKAWGAEYLNIPLQQMSELVLWAETAGIEIFVAWKIPRLGWRFIKPQDFRKNEKNYSLSLKEALSKGVPFSVLVGEQERLKPKKA